MPTALALERLDKRYGEVHAVDGVTIAFQSGELHAVVGENGAGKSTLLKMGAGIVVPDAGSVRVQGKPLRPHTPRAAIRAGVGMVEQHFSLVGAFTALENVMLGAEPVDRWRRVDVAAARRRAEAVAAEAGIALPWDERVESLGVGDRQRLEILRALVRDARTLILDEPTSVLTPGEAHALYQTLRKLTRAGRAVIVVTHRLDEVRDHADVASVLRHGRLVKTRRIDGDPEQIRAVTHAVMGDELLPARPRGVRELGEVVLDVRGVRAGGALRGVSLAVRAGEIVGVAGVEGNGQRELVRVLAGLDVPDGGEVRGGPIVVVHEDRHAEGLVLDASVRDNLVLGELRAFTGRSGFVDAPALEREARARLERARVVPPNLDVPARTLSGGNQQKVVMARAVARSEQGARVLVLAQPTRGVDFVASRAIHDEILRAAEAGKAVVVVSADLAELKALADRIVVVRRGAIVADVPPDTPDVRLGEAMLGVGS